MVSAGSTHVELRLGRHSLERPGPSFVAGARVKAPALRDTNAICAVGSVRVVGNVANQQADAEQKQQRGA